MLKQLEKKKLIRDKDFIQLAYWARKEEDKTIQVAYENLSKFSSETERFNILRRYYSASKNVMAYRISLEGVASVN